MIELIHKDCLKVIPTLPDKSIDLLYTDPPYEQKIGGGGAMESRFGYRKKQLRDLSNFDPIPFLELIKPKLKAFHAYIWTSKNLLDEYISFAKKNNYNWDVLVWVKTNPVPAYNHSYLSDLEFCVFMREKGKCTFNMGLGYNRYKKGMIDRLNNTGLGHPTIKHLWMVENAIKISSNKKDTIIDPFLGSGTTAIACKRLGRNCIGIEKEKDYYNMCVKRVKNTEISLF